MDLSMASSLMETSRIVESLSCFLTQLHLQDSVIRENIIAECIQSLSCSEKQSNDHYKNSSFVCNKALEIFDAALWRYCNLTQNQTLLISLRTELLCQKISTDFLFNSTMGPKLSEYYPVTPNESPIPIKQNTLKFIV